MKGLFSSKAVSFVLAMCVGLITVAFLSLLPSLDYLALWVGGVISFGASFILMYATFEFLIFREIQKITSSFEKIKTNEEVKLRTLQPLVRQSFVENPLRNINKEIVAYASSKEAEINRLKRLENYRKEFIADVSHELKTPIFSAQGYIHTLLDGAIDDEEVKYRFLKKSAKSLNRLAELIEDLLTLSYLESGSLRMNFEDFDIGVLIEEALDPFENKIIKRKLNVIWDEVPKRGLYVHGDKVRIMQVLVNLISNATKYNLDKGDITLKCVQSESSVLIYINNTGAPIPAEDINRIFDRFYRVDKSRSKKQGGTGLGLAIVKHILDNHNTYIEVTSDEENGTSFQFALPRAVGGGSGAAIGEPQ